MGHSGSQRSRRAVGWAVASVVASFAWSASAQNLAPFADNGMRLGVKEVAVLPKTEGRVPPTADHLPTYDTRLNFFKQAPDGRKFVNDERGLLYQLNSTPGGPHNVFLDFNTFEGTATGSLWNRMEFDTGNAAGFVTFEFHPQFNQVGSPGYGKFYTVHTEHAGRAHAAGFTNPYIPKSAVGTAAYDLADLNSHTVISEWTMSNPAGNATAANTTRRELLRAGHPASSYFHPFGDVQFRPTATPGDADHGLLYITGGDWGFINGGGAGGVQGTRTTRSPARSSASTRSPAPSSASTPTPTRRAPAAFRASAATPSPPITPTPPTATPTRSARSGSTGCATGTAWRGTGTRSSSPTSATRRSKRSRSSARARTTAGRRARARSSTAWTRRTAAAATRTRSSRPSSCPPTMPTKGRTPTRSSNTTTMAAGDQAIAGGFVYKGRALPELRGKYVFGDMNIGRLYVADWAEMQRVFNEREAGNLPKTATVLASEFRLFDSLRQTKILSDFVSPTSGNSRADLRFGLGSDGELYLLTGPDGRVRQLLTPVAPMVTGSSTGTLFQGLQTNGGVSASFANVTTAGDLAGLYIADTDVDGLVADGFLSSAQGAAVNFALAGDVAQFWDLGFTGALGAGSRSFTFAYDPSLIGGIDETLLSLFQYDVANDEWDRLAGTVDALNNRITFSSMSFDAMLLGAVPEPSGAATVLLVASAAFTRRRRRR